MSDPREPDGRSEASGGRRVSGVRKGLLNAGLMGVSVLFALVLGEVATRIAFPISDGGENVSLDGSPITAWATPGSRYRQISSEYDALTSITADGYRVPDGGEDPEIVFIGDSFTFGWGVPDSSTFVHVACARARIRCANLGMPSTGTAQHVDRLERFIDEHDWHPRTVVLMMFGMTGNFSAGNDLKDNYDYVRWSGHVPGTRWSEAERGPVQTVWEEPHPGLIERILESRNWLQRNSNLIRIVKYYFGPFLKTVIKPGIDGVRLDEALTLTEAELDRLEVLSREHGFELAIYLIHPLQDIARGTDSVTTGALTEIAPVPVVSTADVFRDDVSRYYYAYDGHLNETGALALGEFLATTLRAMR
jgi:hypothetical protein